MVVRKAHARRKPLATNWQVVGNSIQPKKAQQLLVRVLCLDVWDLRQRANIVIKMKKPICDVLDLSNSDGPTAGKIYDKCFQVRVDMVLFQLAVLMQFYLSNSPLKKKSSLVRSILVAVPALLR